MIEDVLVNDQSYLKVLLLLLLLPHTGTHLDVGD